MENSSTPIRHDPVEKFFASIFLIMGAGALIFSALGFIVLMLERFGIDVFTFI